MTSYPFIVEYRKALKSFLKLAIKANVCYLEKLHIT